MKIIICLFLCLSLRAYALTCALSIEYPPYQYVKDGRTTGLDAKLIKLYNQYTNEKIKMISMKWDLALSELYYSNKFDCIWGMEVTDARQKRYLLTKPIYKRSSTLFVHESSNIKSLNDIKYKIIVGDKDSTLEQEIKKSKKFKSTRIKHLPTKELAMKHLKQKKVSAVIMPNAVGIYLAKKLNVNIRQVFTAREKTPVAVAVKKGNEKLYQMIQETLSKIPTHEIEKIINSSIRKTSKKVDTSYQKDTSPNLMGAYLHPF
ncbi:MAG: hypothetical protein CME66_13290 [Halobacteriovoraceae bacterium]|jgi:polar amino acid transport system substrate-binding protein|nr:hypothetical protein [Halobacteriovoraceae bacterium]